MNIRVFSALLQDRRELRTATDTSGIQNGGRVANLAILAGIWAHCSRRLLVTPVNAAFDQGCRRRRPRGSVAPIARGPSSPRTGISLKWEAATAPPAGPGRSRCAALDSSAATRQGIKNTISPAGNVGERARRRLAPPSLARVREGGVLDRIDLRQLPSIVTNCSQRCNNLRKCLASRVLRSADWLSSATPTPR